MGGVESHGLAGFWSAGACLSWAKSKDSRFSSISRNTSQGLKLPCQRPRRQEKRRQAAALQSVSGGYRMPHFLDSR